MADNYKDLSFKGIGDLGFSMPKKAPVGLDLGLGHAAVRITPGAKGDFNPNKDITLSTGKPDVAMGAFLNEKMAEPGRREAEKQKKKEAEKKNAKAKADAEKKAGEVKDPDEGDFTTTEEGDRLTNQSAEADKVREILSDPNYQPLDNANKSPDGDVYQYYEDKRTGDVWRMEYGPSGQVEHGTLIQMGHAHPYDETQKPGGYYDPYGMEHWTNTTTDQAGYAAAQAAAAAERERLLNSWQPSTFIPQPYGTPFWVDIQNGTPGTQNLLKGIMGRRW